MKKLLLFFASLLSLSGLLNAQTVSITANASTTQLNGLGHLNYHVSEYIYTETEIGATNFITTARAISHINLYASVVGNPNFFGNVKIYLKTVPITTTTLDTATYRTTGYTQVFSGTFTAAAAGWVGVDLTTPFVRTQGTNLQMMIERTDNVDHSSGTAIFTWASANGNNTSATAITSRRYNGTAPLTATTSLSTSAFRVAVQFTSPLAIDAALTSVTAPTLSCNSTTNFSVVLKNNGTSSIAAGAAAVTFRIASPNTYTLTKTNTTTLAANATETIVFNNVNTGGVGSSADSAFVVLAGEQDRSNDTVKSAFTTTSNINVNSNSTAFEGVETNLPVFSYAVTLAGDQLWDIWTAPPRYKNADLTDSLGAHTGTSFFYFDSYSGANSSGFASRLLSNCISLPATAASCTSGLSFWMSHDNSYSTFLDSIYVSISTNKGVTWTRIAGFGRYGAAYTVPTWVQQTLSLTAYQGQTFQIGFEGVSKYGNVMGLDDITISSNCVLPVALTSFKGERRSNINALSWTTQSESNNKGFELQRSADGINFSPITFVASKASAGYSNAPLSYNFDDVKPLSGNGYYRLKQIDKDNKATVSNVVLLKGSLPATLTISSLYPNPVRNNLNLIVSTGKQDVITISTFDLAGKALNTQSKTVVAGDNILQLNTAALATGNYLLKVTNSTGETTTQRFTKQ